MLSKAAQHIASKTKPHRGRAVGRRRRRSLAKSLERLEERIPLSYDLGINLVENGGAESGLSGWSTGGSPSVEEYREYSDSFNKSGFPSRHEVLFGGRRFFWGGYGPKEDTVISQHIDLSEGADSIDAGRIYGDLSAYLGGYADQEDRAYLSVRWLNSQGETIRRDMLRTVAAADRDNHTGLRKRELLDISVPRGTRAARVVLQMDYRDGTSHNDASADQISLVLKKKAMSSQTFFAFRDGNPASRNNVFLEGDALFESPGGGNGFITLAGDLVDRDGDGDKEPARHQKGAIIVQPPRLTDYLKTFSGAIPDPVRSFHADMSVSIHEDFEGSGADGLSFGYGNLSGGAFGEEGDRRSGAGGLWISIDTWDNSDKGDSLGGEDDAVGISVFYGGQGQTPQLVEHWEHSKDALRGSWTDVTVDVTHTGKLSLKFHPDTDGISYDSDSVLEKTVYLPRWNPHWTWQFGVGARTGTAADWHVLEDMTITERVPAGNNTIHWTNRGNDNFDDVFGNLAENARLVVDAVIDGWEQVINDFNYSFGYNLFEVNLSMDVSGDGHGGSAHHDYNLDLDGDNRGEIDPDGRPRQGRIRIDGGDGSAATALSSGWDVGGWFIDATPSDWSEFGDGGIPSPFTGYASSDSPAYGLADLYSVVSHELAHLLGLSSNDNLLLQRDPNGYLTNTGVSDTVYDVGTLWTFDGPSVRALLTSNNGGHGGTEADAPAHTARRQDGDPVPGYAGSTEIENPDYASGQRDLPSNLVALLLKDAYGYEITMPEYFGSFYSSLNEATGELLVRGKSYSDDVVEITRRGDDVRVSINLGKDTPGTGPSDAFVSFYDASEIGSIRIETDSGDDQITLGSGVDIPAHVDGARYSWSSEVDDLTIRGTSGDDTVVTTEDSVTINGVTTTYENIDNLVIDTLGGDDTSTSNGSSTTIRGGAGADSFTVNATGDHELVLDGGGDSDSYTINLGKLKGAVTVRDSAAAGGDSVAIHGTVGNDRLTLSSNRISLGDQQVNLDPAITDVGLDGGGGIDELIVEDESVTSPRVAGIPVVTTIEDQTTGEGAVLSFQPAFTDSDLGDTHSATVDWGDDVTEPVALTQHSGGGIVNASHVYADDGIYTATVTVVDSGGQRAETSWDVTVTNAAPLLAEQPRHTRGKEGARFDLEWAFSDLGTLDTHTATINWGDGSAVETGAVTEAPFGPPGSGDGLTGTVSGSHVYADDGPYTVTVTITDDEGDSDTRTFDVHIANVDPTLTVAGNQTVDEGSLLSLTDIGTFTDPGFDNDQPVDSANRTAETFTYTIDWGDGTADSSGSATVDASGAWSADLLSSTKTEGSFDGDHIYADDGVYTVTVTVIDDDGGFDIQTFDVTVGNVDPVLAVVGNQTVDEGSLLSLTDIGTFTDPGFDNDQPADPANRTAETFSYTIDWGDGTPAATGSATIDAPGAWAADLLRSTDTKGSFDGGHVYADNGEYTVTVTVVDDDGGSDTKSLNVTVANVAPTVGFRGDNLNRDAAGEPLVNSTTGEPFDFSGVRGQTLHFDGTFTDPGFANPNNADPDTPVTEEIDETFSYTIDWGDGTYDSGVADSSSGSWGTSFTESTLSRGSFTGSHVYEVDGQYTVTAMVTDDDSGSTLVRRSVTVAVVSRQAEGDLAVGGSTDQDNIKFERAIAEGEIEVLLDGNSRGVYQPSGRLLAFGQAGKDRIEADGDVMHEVWLYGDDGDDRLKGGAGNDVLFGGRGSDALVGKRGRDMLFGGSGADRIVGNAGDDLMIAAATTLDYDDAYPAFDSGTGGRIVRPLLRRSHEDAVAAIMQEWTSGDSYADRVDHLRNGGGHLAGTGIQLPWEVDDDEARDILTGAAGDDFFVANSDDDRLTDLKDEAFADLLNWVSE